MTTPLEVLREATKAVPAVRYALGIGGIVATIAIVYSFNLSPRVAFVGTVVVLVLMGVLVVFARVATLASPRMLLPAQVFTWFVLLIFIAVTIALFTSVFFRKPLDLTYWLTGTAGGADLVPALQVPDPAKGTSPPAVALLDVSSQRQTSTRKGKTKNVVVFRVMNESKSTVQDVNIEVIPGESPSPLFKRNDDSFFFNVAQCESTSSPLEYIWKMHCRYIGVGGVIGFAVETEPEQGYATGEVAVVNADGTARRPF